MQARRINESGKGSMDKSGQEIMKKQWLALQEAQKKVLEIATEKVQLAEQAQRHVQNHMARLEELHRKFEKELAKSDPEGLQDVLGGHGVQREHQAQALPRKKKQPVRFDLVGKWIAIEYDDEAAKAERPNDPVEKVWYNGLVMVRLRAPLARSAAAGRADAARARAGVRRQLALLPHLVGGRRRGVDRRCAEPPPTPPPLARQPSARPRG